MCVRTCVWWCFYGRHVCCACTQVCQCVRTLHAQGAGGHLVFTATQNCLKPGSFAFTTFLCLNMTPWWAGHLWWEQERGSWGHILLVAITAGWSLPIRTANTNKTDSHLYIQASPVLTHTGALCNACSTHGQASSSRRWPFCPKASALQLDTDRRLCR